MNAYPVLGKAKSKEICKAFLEGCPPEAKGSVFYGVDQTNIHHWKRVSADKSETWFYIDNSFFDKTRGTYFRIGQNVIQREGKGESNGQRFKALGLEIKPWRKTGTHIVVCPQSESFMRDVAGWKGDWLSSAIGAMALSSKRRFRVRVWNRNKAEAMASLLADLKDAWALATYSSAAAITALLEGIPVACCAGAAYSMGVRIGDIEQPIYPEDRERFFGVLANSQWTLDEMRNGTAWKALSAAGSS